MYGLKAAMSNFRSPVCVFFTQHSMGEENNLALNIDCGLWFINPLNAELNPICYLLALLGAHHFLHVSRIKVKPVTLVFISISATLPCVSYISAHEYYPVSYLVISLFVFDHFSCKNSIL